MAWRFKASKYKNAAPIVPKPEACIRDIFVGSYQTYGNNITASATFMAFNVDHNGSSLAVLPIDDCGRKSKTMPLLHAHSDTVTDMDFSPFHDNILATGSQDCLVKIWQIPENGLEENLTNSECTFSHKQRRVETVCFHPVADCLLTSTSFTTLTLWDILAERELFSNADHCDVIQSVSWKKDGILLATSCKDKQVRVVDPRASVPISQSANSHQSIKDSRIVWLGDSNRILTTGFDSGRQREVYIRDLRNFEEIEKSLVLDSSTGVLIPLYDPDTGMLFLAGKGDTTIAYMEVTDKEPYLVEGIRHNGDQTKGACLVPKRALAVMQAEVNRVLQLTSSSVIPIMYQVPRKSYRDFHGDLFPETAGNVAPISASQWSSGINAEVARVSLDPAKRHLVETGSQVNSSTLSEMRKHLHLKQYVTSSPQLQQQNKKQQLSYRSNATKEEETKSTQQNGETTHDHQNGTVTAVRSTAAIPGPVPPKPLPRSSRQSSLTEADEPIVAAVPAPRPVARPRMGTTCPSSVSSQAAVPSQQPQVSQESVQPQISPVGTVPPSASVVTPVNPLMLGSGGYKPRLGPKPFTPPKLNFGVGSGDAELKITTDFSFDKVFSVPSVPAAEVNGAVATREENSNDVHTDDSAPETYTETFPVDCQESDKNEVCAVVGDQDISPTTEDELPSSPNSKTKTPSTAERRKVFEKRISSMTTEQDSGSGTVETLQSPKGDECIEDKLEDFERASLQRTSIAERRRLYENRSVSVQETSIADKRSPTTLSPTPLRRRDSLKSQKPILEEDKPQRKLTEQPTSKTPPMERKQEPVTTPTPKRTSTVFGRVSKFRHLKGTPLHKSTHIENIRNVSRQISGECDGFHANSERVAVPLSGPGGKIAVFEISRTGKLPDGVIPTLVQGTNVMDFAWDPFDSSRLAVACDDGTIRLWLVPEGGLPEPTNTPDQILAGHSEKIYFIKFHPLAKDILASGSYDMTIRIWDLATQCEKIVLLGHTDQMFCFAWSPCGAYCATACKDGKLRVYEPRVDVQPIREGKGPVGSRGARIVWALDGQFLVVTGFDKVSERQIQIFKADSLNSPLNTVGLDVSPAILIPFYDEDSSTLFVTGKGDSTIYAFEVTEEAPYLCPLSHHRCNSLHQGLSFLPKNVCDVSSVEFARAMRLTNNTIEPLSFTVPRLKSELFQDDLFPPTKVTWKPTMTSTEWLGGFNKTPSRLSLKPQGMESLSETQGCQDKQNTSSQGKTISSLVQQPFNRLAWNAEMSDATKETQEQIQRAVSSRMEVNLKLEQDDMEGVDDREWED
ncbi:coronin-7 isoform X1 [Schistocerca serialis cubense]|uniref:coronin-7 isoform X1 n=1 Tax=Schistocerca serialis cubense TaxID=2023355 RepID=UPI00214E57E1|nr:coronin-7 isoform X1 [Schistocerca serialis cubense]